MSAKSRCWAGYEPVPGKAAYSKGSCRKIAPTTSSTLMSTSATLSISEVVKEIEKLLALKDHIKIRDYLKKNKALLNSEQWKNGKTTPDYLKYVGIFADHTNEKAKHIIPAINAGKNLFAKHKISY
jgi:hypothetical protein